MKKLSSALFFVLVLGLIGYVGYQFYLYFRNPCDQTLSYSIGRFDSQFGLSEVNFKNYLAEAERPWEGALKRELFVYDPTAKFKINLIYDERQQLTEAKRKTEFGLTAIEDIFQKLDAEFLAAKAVYEARVASYKRALDSFEARKREYENQVRFWNNKNGAPKNEYEILQREQEYLNSEVARLNQESIEVNRLSNELNLLLEKRNSAAADYNRVAKDYNEEYGHGLEFNQAEYTNGEINVYQFGDKKDLVLAMAHEFGHALGMDHVENPNSIMYFVTQNMTKTVSTISDEDMVELARVCGLKTVKK